MNILVLSPHPDDAEISCGASIVRFLEEGHQVNHMIFSTAENVNNEVVSIDRRKREVLDAQMCLGCKHWSFRVFPHRQLHLYRDKVRDELLSLRDSMHPELVFMPCIGDLHQDHETVTKEALRVFKGVSILGYETLRNNLQFKAQAFIRLEEKHIQRKIKAVECYKTQSFRNYTQPEFIRSLAISRGVQVDAEYAEAFEVIRWVQ